VLGERHLEGVSAAHPATAWTPTPRATVTKGLVRRVVSWVAIVAVASAACGGNVEPTGDGGTDVGATPNRCPSSFPSVSVCAPTPGGVCVHNNPTLGCALDALPSELPCSGVPQCSMLILPCLYEVQTWTGTGRVDVYICSCIGCIGRAKIATRVLSAPRVQTQLCSTPRPLPTVTP
jgi:hypothetical protein